jgi:dimethylhistidine N-methyltransferase
MMYEPIHLIDLSPAVSHKELFRDEVILGLLQERKSIPPRFFYDRKGSELFEKICEQPEYYPTRTEKTILETHVGEIVERIGTQATLIELGSGASVKTRLLLNELADPCAYVPIDISRDFLIQSSQELAMEYSGLPVIPVWADYTHMFSRLEREFADHSKKVLFFPGSTIGNMEPALAKSFLEECSWFLSKSGESGKMLIGFDLVKDSAILDAAYNDAAGVTAAFNLNLLERMNRELSANFELSRFQHRAFFNAHDSRIEMHLLSLEAQEVEVGGRKISFQPEETIHTENSYKYTTERFQALAQATGFECEKIWTDPKNWFAVALIEAKRQGAFLTIGNNEEKIADEALRAAV